MRTERVVVPLAAAFALLTVLAPVAGASAVAGGSGSVVDGSSAVTAAVETPGEATAAATVANEETNSTQEAPPDPEEDVKGWENGYWANESLPDVDPSDGYTDEEIAKVRARSMARIEVVRDVEFEVTPPVRVISREQYQQNVADRFQRANISTADRLHQNVKFEALFMIGEDDSYFAAQQQLQATSIAGFYVYGNASGIPGISEGEIVLVSDSGDTPKLSEITLAQELFHSLQDQQFKTTGDYDVVTEEDNLRITAVIEGDGNYVDYLYEQRCGAEWDCFQPATGPGGGGRPNLGLLVFNVPQYTEGPAWVAEIEEQGGWEAVNDLYDNPPESTEQYIHPEKYLEDAPTDVTVRDRSTEEWSILDLPGEGSVDYAQFGEAGVYAMLWYSSPAVPNNDIFTGRDLDAYDYNHPASAGWDGDKLYPYVNDTSGETNETGYVWKTVWDSPEDAEEFAEAYTQILTSFGDAVEGRQSTYRITSGQFDDAFYVNVSDSTVTIVNAPGVSDLSEVRSGAAPEVEVTPTPTATATETATPTETQDGTTDGTTTATTEPDDTATTEGEAQPGFGLALAVVAVLAALVLLRRRD